MQKKLRKMSNEGENCRNNGTKLYKKAKMDKNQRKKGKKIVEKLTECFV